MKKSSESGGFPPKTRRELADRAGHHCSLCLALTTCSDEGGKPFPIGDAAHQAAASVGGPRYDPNQTKAERSSAKNGLWLCGSCHRKIDGDKYRYTAEDLKQMKERAEDRARRMVHGEIVFEMKDKEHAAIEHYFDSRPLSHGFNSVRTSTTPVDLLTRVLALACPLRLRGCFLRMLVREFSLSSSLARRGDSAVFCFGEKSAPS
jgi:cytochrome c553